MKRIKNLACMLAAFSMVMWTCIPTLAGLTGALPNNMPWELAVESPHVSIEPAQGLPVEPLLAATAQKVIVTSGPLGTVKPGQTLNVTLGIGDGSAPRTVPRGPMGPLGPLGTARTPRTQPTPSRPAGPRPITRRPTGSGGIPIRPVATSPALTDDIPCELLPTGCPPPVDVPGTTPGQPGIQFTNFHVVAKWAVFKSVNGNPGAALSENKDFASPMSQGPTQSFVMAPLRLTDYTGAAPPADPYVIVATVAVTADKTVLSVPPTTTKVISPEVPVKVPLSLSSLEVPSVFVLFLHENFSGAAAIYLPRSSTLNETQLKLGAGQLLETYNSAVSTLNFVTWFGSYVAGLQALQNVFELPHVDVKELKNAEANLNDDDFIHRSALSSVNDTEVEDESSSLLLLGPPNTKVQFFQDRDFSGGEFDVQTGNLPTDFAPGVMVRNFNTLTPQSEPRGKLTLVASRKFRADGRDVTPNDRLSSFKWVR